ncbi:RHS repeat-associated core domain-containing protein [Pseudomonas sp. BF-B-30]|uniref:RHS repeat-associated core domain-containing protein n=1 Tax=Pseudomonas sp. BF-B-30 TaxID=2832388 RepID=UPI0039891951
MRTLTQKPITYSPYGHRHPENGWLSLLEFNGERPDPVTGHYLLGNGYRAFNPVLMRFNSSDSWSPFGDGGLNAYAYCAGDPINKHDPSGHMFGKITSGMARTGILEYALKGKNLKRHAHINPNQAKTAAIQINQITEKLKHLNNNISATLQTDFNLREGSSIMAPPTLNLETFARNRIILSDLPMHSLPPKLRHHPPLDPDSPNQLSDQINLMEYINGYSKSSKKDKLWRLNQAADYHQTRFIKNSTETPLNMDLAQKYRKKLHLITRNRRALKEIRTETFNSHFHY